MAERDENTKVSVKIFGQEGEENHKSKEEEKLSREGFNNVLNDLFTARLHNPVDDHSEQKKAFDVIARGKENNREDKEELGDNWPYIDPPFDPSQFLNLGLISNTLKQCVDAAVDGIYGKGYRLEVLVDKKEKERIADEIKEEKEKIDLFLESMDVDGSSHNELKRKTGANLEYTGNAFWEVVRLENKEVYAVQLLESNDMRIGPASRNFMLWDRPYFVNGEWIKKKVPKRFRRFVQLDETGLDGGYIFFKEFGDPRIMDSRNGKLYSDEEFDELDPDQKAKVEEYKATEIIHFKYYYPGTVYGIPRYPGAIMSIVGSILKEQNDIAYFSNSMKSDVVITSDRPLTPDSIENIKKFVKKSENMDNARKAIILVPESIDDVVEDGKNVAKITVKEMNVRRDANFLKYDEVNKENIKSSFRLSDLHIGKNRDFNRATAETAQEVVEDIVFKTSRENFDNWINTHILSMLDVKFHRYVSKPSIAESMSVLMDAALKAKDLGMTLRESRKLLVNIFDIDFEDLEKLDESLVAELLDVPLFILKDNSKTLIPGAEEETPETEEETEEEIEEEGKTKKVNKLKLLVEKNNKEVIKQFGKNVIKKKIGA